MQSFRAGAATTTVLAIVINVIVPSQALLYLLAGLVAGVVLTSLRSDHLAKADGWIKQLASKLRSSARIGKSPALEEEEV